MSEAAGEKAQTDREAPERGMRLAPDERRRRLLEVSVELFSEQGFDSVSVADVADRAGVSKALIFRYFGSKRALFIESLRDVADTLAIVSDPGPELPAGERFRAGLEGLLDLVEERPHAMPTRPLGEIAADPEAAELIAAINDRLADRIIERLGIERPPAELRFAVDAWFEFVRGSTRNWLATGEFPRERLMDLQIATFRALVAEVLGVEPVPSGPGAGPPFLP